MRLLIAAALALTASAATAADMRPAAPLPAWAGLYAGIHGGYGAARFADDTSGSSASGGFAGGQIGYNWQSGNVVWGVEIDSAWADLGRTDRFAFGGVSITADSYLDYLGTARARLGYATGNALLYVTGGAAWAHGNLDIRATGGGVTAGTSADNMHVGWTVGGGAEWLLMPQWSMKLEYLYADYGSESYFGDAITAQTHTVKLGLNYLFR